MAALSILVHNGELSPSDIQAGAETLHDITLTNDVEQLITYYDMLLEYQAVSNVVMYAPTLLTQDERVDNLLNCAERCKEKGTYFMVAIRAGGTFLEGSSAVTLPNPVIDCIIVLKICAKIANQLIIDN